MENKNAWRPGGNWETDFYTPAVLGGATLLDSSEPELYKIQGP